MKLYKKITFLVCLITMLQVNFNCAYSSSQLPYLNDKDTMPNLASMHHATKSIRSNFSGNVSWYGPGFDGKKTASGEIFNSKKVTAAHLTLPFSTRVLVESPRTGKSVIVKVNDRGPYVKTRVMDLSKEGARRLGSLPYGVVYADCLVIE